MPVNSNVAIQNVGTVAWTGASAVPADIRKHNRFAWSFEVIVPIAVDAVFNIEAAPPSLADNCVPGTFGPVEAIATCQGGDGGPQASVTIPAGTAVGTICSGTIPCRPDAFVRLAPAGGDVSSIRAVLIRQGPMY